MKAENTNSSNERSFLQMLQELFSTPAVVSLKKPYLWKDFMEYMSQEVDRKILNHCKENKYTYVGGKCRFTPTVNETEFDKTTVLNVDAELYFRLPDGERMERLPLHTERNYHDFNLEDKDTLRTLRGLLKERLEVTVAKPE